MPPPLSRMSSTSPCAPSRHELRRRGLDFLRRVLVERLQRDVADVVAEHRRRYGTAGTCITARVNVQLDRLGHAGSRERHAAPWCPATPRSASDTLSIFASAVGSVSTWMMRSPSRTPPSSAGVCGKTRLTTMLVRSALLLLEQHADAAVPAAGAAIELLVLPSARAARCTDRSARAPVRAPPSRRRSAPAASRRIGSRRCEIT